MLMLPVILFGIFLTVDCRNLATLFSTKRQTSGQFDYFCYDLLHNCHTGMRRFDLERIYSDYSSIREFLQEDFIDDMCRALREMDSCTQRVLETPGCDPEYYHRGAGQMAMYTDYVCANKTKQLLMAMQDSPCASDESLARQMERAGNDCVDLLYRNRAWDYFDERPEEGACVIEHVVKPCIMRKAKTLCGDTVAEFALDAWQNLLTAVGPPDWVCPPDHSAPRL